MFPSRSYFLWYKSSVLKTGSHSLTKSQEVAVLAPVFAGSCDTGQVMLLPLPSEGDSYLTGLPQGSDEKSVCGLESRSYSELFNNILLFNRF